MAGALARWMLAAAVAAASAAGANAQDLDGARRDYGEGRYEQALRELRPLAESGRSEAQYLLGLAYRDGHGVGRDAEVAATWFRRAAESGHVEAQYELALAAFSGEAGTSDRGEAERWYLKAANQGHAKAAFALASLWLAGAHRTDEALRWLKQAADAGLAPAATRLGLALEAGLGDPSLGTAAEWLARAGRMGDPEAVYRLALGRAGSDGERMAVMRKAASAGYAPAQHELAGVLLADGAAGNAPEGIALLEQAAAQGHAGAQFDLAIAYRDGLGVHADGERFRQWLERASDAGFAKARYELANCLAQGRDGFGKDPERAAGLYRQAAALGSVEARYGLGFLLSNGIGVERDFEGAARVFREAAEAGHAASQVALGNLYANGQGVTQSEQQARTWYCAAARQGHPEAIGFLQGDLETACAPPRSRNAGDSPTQSLGR